MVLRFTDSTAAELHKASAGAGQSDSFGIRNSELLRHTEASTNFMRTQAQGQSRSAPAPGRPQPRCRAATSSPPFTAARIATSSSRSIRTASTELAPEEVSLIRWDSRTTGDPPATRLPAGVGRTPRAAPAVNEHNGAYRFDHRGPRRHHRKERIPHRPCHRAHRAEQDGVAVDPASTLSHAARQQGRDRQSRSARLRAGEQGPGLRLRRHPRPAAQEGRDRHDPHRLWRQGCCHERG